MELDLNACIRLLAAVIHRWLLDAAAEARRGNPATLKEAIFELGLPESQTLQRLNLPADVLTAVLPSPAPVTKREPAFEPELARRVVAMLNSGASPQDLPRPVGLPAGHYHRQRFKAGYVYLRYTWQDENQKCKSVLVAKNA